MIGFPKHINSRQDIYNLLPEYPAETRAHLSALLGEVMVWRRDDAPLVGPGVTDATHRVDVVVETANHPNYDTGNGYALEIAAASRSLFAELVVGLNLALESGAMTSSALISFRDATGATRQETVATLKGLLAGYSLYCKGCWDNPTIERSYQVTLIEDQNCRLYGLGFTVAEAEAIIGGAA